MQNKEDTYRNDRINFNDSEKFQVRGKLMCDGRPAAGVKVKLWDVDRSELFELENKLIVVRVSLAASISTNF